MRRGAGMGRFARSWALVKLCWQVLQQDKELVVFPIVSTIGVLIVTASFVVPGFFTGFWQGISENGAGVGLLGPDRPVLPGRVPGHHLLQRRAGERRHRPPRRRRPDARRRPARRLEPHRRDPRLRGDRRDRRPRPAAPARTRRHRRRHRRGAGRHGLEHHHLPRRSPCWSSRASGRSRRSSAAPGCSRRPGASRSSAAPASAWCSACSASPSAWSASRSASWS